MALSEVAADSQRGWRWVAGWRCGAHSYIGPLECMYRNHKLRHPTFTAVHSISDIYCHLCHLEYI